MDPHVLDDLGPLYHSYRLFGVANKQLEQFRINQRCGEAIVLGYISLAIGKATEQHVEQPSFCELFCGEGYYTMLASWLGANPAVGIDSNRDGWSDRMIKIASRLNLPDVQHERRDVQTIAERDAYDIVANLGGLYHIENPVEVLRKSYDLARRYLIVQTVVTAANNDPNYFASPAPGLSFGSRYSRASFINMVKSEGYRVLDAEFKHLAGNADVEDQGSIYMLIQKG
ncbi:MAG TPA: hypothetical protein VK702_11615 [Candidatus Acidoferrum sp.]|jgi:hypothetical protein|nr:hypothetical protein [Candidatus Acidoferrum sp.]